MLSEPWTTVSPVSLSARPRKWGNQSIVPVYSPACCFTRSPIKQRSLPEPESPASMANPPSPTAHISATSLWSGDFEGWTRLFPPCRFVVEYQGVPVQQENEDITITSLAPCLSGGEQCGQCCLGFCSVACCRPWCSVNMRKITSNYEKRFSCRRIEPHAGWFALRHSGSYKQPCSRTENSRNAISIENKAGWQPRDWDWWR